MLTDQNTADLLHLFSPNLPIGAFAFSQGLEGAIETDLVFNPETFTRWVEGVLRYGLRTLDFVYFRMAYEACDYDWQELNGSLLASRESLELLREDQLLGASLKKWAIEQDIALPEAPEYSLVCVYARIAATLDLPLKTALTGLGWSYIENQAQVAAKAIPLGQSALQGCIAELKPVLLECVDNIPSVPSNSSHMQALLSAAHETQYSRLFRS